MGDFANAIQAATIVRRDEPDVVIMDINMPGKISPFKLFEAINDIIEGGAPMSPSIAKRVLQSFEIKSSAQQYHLTVREKEILQLLVKGYSIKNNCSRTKNII